MVLGRLDLMTVIGMSRAEIDRVHILRDVVAERITVREAAQLLRITRRQVFRLLKAYQARGSSGVSVVTPR
jgi:DNA-binding NtrC family response regulator